MSAARSYPRLNVSDRRGTPPPSRRQPPPTPSDDDVAAEPGAAEPAEESAPTPDRIDLSSLPIAGISRRHVAWIAAGLVSAWIVVIFARQVGDASAAAARATQLAADNAALSAEVHSLENEVALIVRPEFVAQEARGHQLGAAREIPFTLDPSMPAPVDGAPGSASARLGARDDRQTPLESWLSLLFGPGN
jgi:cell division protein FtsB